MQAQLAVAIPRMLVTSTCRTQALSNVMNNPDEWAPEDDDVGLGEEYGDDETPQDHGR